MAFRSASSSTISTSFSESISLHRDAKILQPFLPWPHRAADGLRETFYVQYAVRRAHGRVRLHRAPLIACQRRDVRRQAEFFERRFGEFKPISLAGIGDVINAARAGVEQRQDSVGQIDCVSG